MRVPVVEGDLGAVDRAFVGFGDLAGEVDAVGNWAEDTGKYLEDKASDAWNSASDWTWDKLGI